MEPSPLTLSTIEAVLQQEMGLRVSSLGNNSIKKALSRRMKTLSLEDFHAYVSLIKKSTQELNEFIDEVAINETWFYRDEAPFKALSKYALSILDKHPNGSIRLLSMPCSTGEEPYSMAISLLEAGFNEHQYIIDAIDISARSLTVAQEGVYRKNSFRGHSKRFQKRYFDTIIEKSSYMIKENVKKNVTFKKGNLLNLNFPLAPKSYNVIFCRNLLIYLDQSFHKKVIKILGNLLKDDGLLFIGHSESGLFLDSQFKPAPYPKTFSFCKKESLLDIDQSETGFNCIEENIPNHFETETGALTSALNFSPQNQSMSPSVAKTATENGEYDKAIHIYEKIIEEKGPSANIFYLMANNFYEISEFNNSIRILKKAIYLDPDFVEAIDLLSRIYKELGDEHNFQSSTQRSKRVQQRLSHDSSIQSIEYFNDHD